MLMVLMMLAGCAPKEERADIAAEFIHTVWDVDYASYSEDAMTSFAKKHYTKDYFADFMRDPYANAGVGDIKKEKLVSRVLGTEHIESYSFDDVDGNTYLAESIRAFVSIDSFEPQEETLFKAGEVYTLIYDIYFTQKDGIVGFDMIVDTADAEALSDAERAAAGEVIRGYVYNTWSVEESYSAADVLIFYEENLSSEFMERDGITEELLSARESEVKTYGILMRVTELSVYVQPHMEYASVGMDKVMCYRAEAEYSVETSGNAEYLAAVGLKQNMDIKENIYFEIADGNVTLIGAEYK